MLGSLVEKALSTPQQYPLTLSALVAACNQTSNREPVVSYGEQTVETALHELKDLRLVRFVLPSHGRSVVRYRQVLDENLGLDARQSAVLAVLLLRGPQTVGELRLRTERMSRFDGLDEVQHELDLLGARDEPLVTNVGRRPGQKEERWASLLVGTAARESVPDPVPVPVPVPVPLTDDGSDDRTDVAVSPSPVQHQKPDQADELRSEVADLRAEVAELRRALDELRTSLGG